MSTKPNLLAICCEPCNHENRNQLPDSPTVKDMFFCDICKKPAETIWKVTHTVHSFNMPGPHTWEQYTREERFPAHDQRKN